MRKPPSNEVQQDLRKVADGLDADPTLDEILLDILTRDASPPWPEPVLEGLSNPISGYREVIPALGSRAPVTVAVKVYTEIIEEGVVIRKVVRDIANVRASTGDSVAINYRIDLQP